MNVNELSMLCELIAIATLVGWVVCLVVGLGLCAADRALLTGIPGTFLGGALFELLGWPVGLTIGGYPLVPAVFGTALVLFVVAYVSRLRSEIEQRREEAESKDVIRRFRDWSAAPHRARP